MNEGHSFGFPCFSKPRFLLLSPTLLFYRMCRTRREQFYISNQQSQNLKAQMARPFNNFFLHETAEVFKPIVQKHGRKSWPTSQGTNTNDKRACKLGFNLSKISFQPRIPATRTNSNTNLTLRLLPSLLHHIPNRQLISRKCNINKIFLAW